jgi:tetratricopeptide (TPR) repeat protein
MVSTPALRADQNMEYFTMGSDLYKQGNYQDSAVILEGVVRVNPGYWQAYEILGHDYVSLGDYKRALADCEKSLSLHPDNPDLKTFYETLKTLPPPTPTPAGVPSKSSTPAAGSTGAPAHTDHSPSYFYLGLAGGADLAGQGWQSAYTAGPGGKILLGYQFDPNWAFQLDLEGFYFTGVNFSGAISDIEGFALPSLHYSFRDGWIGPYLMAGAGGEFELLSGNPGLTVADLDAFLGAGLEADLGNRAFLFVEGKYNFILSANATANDTPVLAGARFGL